MQNKIYQQTTLEEVVSCKYIAYWVANLLINFGLGSFKMYLET